MNCMGPQSVNELEDILYRGADKGDSDAIRTDWGPGGRILIVNTDVGIIIISDTIAFHKCDAAEAYPELYEQWIARDIETEDGNAPHIILAEALLEEAKALINVGFCPKSVAYALSRCNAKAKMILFDMAVSPDMPERHILMNGASLVLNSTVMRQHTSFLAPLAVDAVLAITESHVPDATDLRRIKIMRHLGGTLAETELVQGLVFSNVKSGTNGPKRVENAKIALMYFGIPPPEVDLDYSLTKEERSYIIRTVKQIKRSGCNVLLIPKNMMGDAKMILALHYLDKCKILVVDIEDEDITFACQILKFHPITALDDFLADNFVEAQLVEQVHMGTKKFVKITGFEGVLTATVLLKGSSDIELHQAARSLEFAMCVVRCMLDKPDVLPGAGALETALALKMDTLGQGLKGMCAYCFSAYASAVERIPFLLAKRAGLDPYAAITELRIRHARGEKAAGIDMSTGAITINAGEEDWQSERAIDKIFELADEHFKLLISATGDAIAAGIDRESFSP